MLIFHDLPGSPSCLKTRILLHELGIPYETRTVDRAALAGHPFRARFPSGQAPAIEDGELRLSESAAIALYLGEKHGALIPAEPARRARMFQALFLEAALLAPTVGGQGLFGELSRPEAARHPPRIDELRREAQHVAQVLGAVLGERPYFADELSVADVQLYVAVHKSLEHRVFDDPPANLVAWHARMAARPAVIRASGTRPPRPAT